MSTAIQLTPSALHKAQRAFSVFENLIASIAQANGQAGMDEIEPLLSLIRNALASANTPSPTHPKPHLRLVK